MKITSSGLASMIGDDLSPANLQAQLLEWWGIRADHQDIDEILASVERIT